MRFEDLDDENILIKLSSDEFSEETIRKSLYWMEKGNLKELYKENDEWKLIVYGKKSDIKKIKDWLAKTLNDFRLREMIRKKTNNFQDQIASVALSSLYK